LKILIACEFSGIVRDAFIARGHDAISCDLLPTEKPGPHYQGDVLDIISDGYDMMIAFPPCTYLCSSGLHWNKRVAGRDELTHQAMLFVFNLTGEGFIDHGIKKIAIENPIGCISSKYRKPDQVIQPYQFGHDASKSTCLWLKNLPLLRPTSYIEPRIVDGKKRWSNQTDGGQNKLGPSDTRAMERSRTYEGIAAAMAGQWG
jgi:hypothetical protein